MRVTYNEAQNSAYIAFADDKPGVGYVVMVDPEEAGSTIHLDFDLDGRLCGMEVQDASSVLPHELLRQARA